MHGVELDTFGTDPTDAQGQITNVAEAFTFRVREGHQFDQQNNNRIHLYTTDRATQYIYEGTEPPKSDLSVGCRRNQLAAPCTADIDGLAVPLVAVDGTRPSRSQLFGCR